MRVKNLTAAGLFLIGLVFAQLSPALAIGEDVFVVPRVAVQAQASSATAAKSMAQRQGRRRAMDILLRRLTIEEDWAYLPQLASEAKAETPVAEPAVDPIADALATTDRNVITLTDNDLERLESGFEVYNEKSSSATYRAFITYRFKPAAVRKLLKDSQIPYSEAQTRTALVLPILQTETGLYLWEENNPWMAAWKARPYNNELTPMTAPLGDLEDAASITARKALNLDQTAMQVMADRYSVSQVIVAHAFLQQIDGEDRLRVRLMNGFRESGELTEISELDPTSVSDVETRDFAVQGPDTNAFIPAKVGDLLAEGWFRQPSGSFPALAERSIDTTIAKYAKPWKERTLIDHNVSGLLETSAFYQSIGEWSKIRSALVGTPLVGSVQVRAMSRRGAEMLIRAYGDPGKLIVAMESQGLALWTEDGDRWMIATPSTAQSVRGRSRRSRRNRLGDNEYAAPDYQPAAIEEAQSATESRVESRYD
ncbi:MAG: DUF2066 domain-containing protein [Pseudomonadota bacterium]